MKLSIFATIMTLMFISLVQSATIRRESLTPDEQFSKCMFEKDDPSTSIIELSKKCLIQVTGVTIQEPSGR
ncbi:hypothetical protein BJ944DRAFT_263493 [Cunninghamella echinulata]|nr:hypothetical protein BJ944DRAFT_263493 [Cunninghamella echinulata]